jgi:molybdopterin converting factor small subunit
MAVNFMEKALPREIIDLTEEGRKLFFRMQSSDWIHILRSNTKSVSDLRNELSELISKLEENQDSSQNIYIISKNNQNVGAVVPLSLLENMIKAQDTLNSLIEHLQKYEDSALLEESLKRWDSNSKRYNLMETITELKIDPGQLLKTIENQEGSLLE